MDAFENSRLSIPIGSTGSSLYFVIYLENFFPSRILEGLPQDEAQLIVWEKHLWGWSSMYQLFYISDAKVYGSRKQSIEVEVTYLTVILSDPMDNLYFTSI